MIVWPAALACSQDFSYVEKLFASEGKEPLPLVIAIHGLGDSPEHFRPLFDQLGVPARLILPRAPDPWPEGTSWFPIDDRKERGTVLRKRAAELADFATRLSKAYKTRGLPIVTGFSQGGCLTFALAAYHSEKFSAALPVAGMLPPTGPAYRKARSDFQVSAFHGDIDERIPLADGQRTTDALVKAGTHAKLTHYAKLGHWFNDALERDYFTTLRAELARTR